jgi:protease I
MSFPIRSQGPYIKRRIFEMELDGKRIAVLCEHNYQTLELWYPVLRMREAGAKVTLVGSGSAETYNAENTSYPVRVDTSIDRVKIDDFDAVIVPGGYSPDRMRRYPAMVKLVKDAADQGKVVAAICHGPWMFCSAEIVQGKRVTSAPSIKDDLRHAGGEWVDEEVVVSGNVITSRKPDDLPAFCRAIIKGIQGK